MKKMIYLSLSILTVLTLCGCNKKVEDDPVQKPSVEENNDKSVISYEEGENENQEKYIRVNNITSKEITDYTFNSGVYVYTKLQKNFSSETYADNFYSEYINNKDYEVTRDNLIITLVYKDKTYENYTYDKLKIEIIPEQKELGK